MVKKARITVSLRNSALFYDLILDRTATISNQSDRGERDFQELFRRARP